jgi:hypothetical protein
MSFSWDLHLTAVLPALEVKSVVLVCTRPWLLISETLINIHCDGMKTTMRLHIKGR